MKHYLAIFACLGLLSGCQNLQNFKVAHVPIEVKHKEIQVLKDRPAPDVVSFKSYGVSDHSVYFNQIGGGSLPLVMLFGPVGSLISAANIAHTTQKMGSSGEGSSLFKLDAIQEAAQSLASQAIMQTDAIKDPSKLNLQPFIILYVDEQGKTINSIAGFRVETSINTVAGSSSWSGHYHYALENTLEIDALKNPVSNHVMSNYLKELHTGFQALFVELKKDIELPDVQDRKIAMIWAPILKSTKAAFAGFAIGDIEVRPENGATLRVNMNNFSGLIMNNEIPYVLWVFPSSKQYKFDETPVVRKNKPS